MKFEYLNEINREIINQFMNLTNEVIKKTHSIGFIKDLNFEATKELLQAKVSKTKSALLLFFEEDNTKYSSEPA